MTFAEACEKFVLVCHECKEHGGTDREVLDSWQHYMIRCIEDPHAAPPASARAWHLFSDMPGADAAAARLTEAAEVCAGFARQAGDVARRVGWRP